MATKRKRTEPPAKQWPQVIECIGEPYLPAWQFGGNVPQVGNGRVSVERFRITIEKVDEPPEVIHERIRKLWRTTKNYHHYDPLKRAAAQFGLDLDSKDFGADVPPEKPEGM